MAIFQDNSPLLLRLKWLQALITLVFALLLANVWHLTVVQFEYYWQLAERNHVRTIPLIAPRGLIYDREGRVLVDNIQVSNLVLFDDKVKNFDSTIAFLVNGLRVHRETIQHRLQAVRNDAYYQPMVVKENLTIEEIAYLLSHQIEHPELAIVEHPRRIYRYGKLAAHVMGYVGEVSRQQLGQPEFSDNKPGDIIGKYGLERTYNPVLTGRDGLNRVLVDSLGKTLEKLSGITPQQGKALKLTLDLDLQLVAETELVDHPGAVIAFDPRNGEILVMASRPTFDPNEFAVRIAPQKWSQLINNPDHPLQNRAVQNTFSPGSIFKLVTALVGLEQGIVDEKTTVHCQGGVSLYGQRFRCWKPDGHGIVSLTKAIQQSCNVYFYLLGQKLEIDTISDFSRRLGLGQLTGIDLFGEVAGLVPSDEWKRRLTGEVWYAGETISVAIGQGPLHVTPIQVARAIGIIATRRNSDLHLASDERLRKRHKVTSPPVVPSFVAENLQAIHEGMWQVVNERGTGQAAYVAGFKVCGKTGTAQIISSDVRARLSKEKGRKFKPNAWFVGFAPRDNPEIVVTVIVQRGESGGSTAAPIAQKILQHYYAKHKTKPATGMEVALKRGRIQRDS